MPEGVIPAWVAEMDYAVDPVVLEPVQRMLADGITGYPLFGWDRDLAESYAGVRVANDVLSGPGGVVFPTPGYNAQHGLAGVTGRAENLLEVLASADRAEIDLDRSERSVAQALGPYGDTAR